MNIKDSSQASSLYTNKWKYGRPVAPLQGMNLFSNTYLGPLVPTCFLGWEVGMPT